jgi:hypothetical protein
MGWDEPDVYSQPAKFGLVTIGDVNFGSGYDYAYFVVWQEASTNKLYYGEDSGCSCFSPFEDFNDIADLTEATAIEICEKLDARAGTGVTDSWDNWELSQVADLKDRVMNL